MEKKEFLTEENYHNINNKIKSKGKLITNIGLGIGVGLILIGVILIVSGKLKGNSSMNSVEEQKKSTEEQIALKEKELETEEANLKLKLDTVKADLNAKKQALIDKGIKESSNYNDGEAYDLYILDNVLSPSFDHCWFDQYNQNEMTKDYCTLRNFVNGDDFYYSCEDNEVLKVYCTKKSELNELNRTLNELEFDIDHSSRFTNGIKTIGSAAPFIMFGFFICFASGIGKFMLFMITRRREIMSYGIQQVMPVAQEGIEKIAPTIGKAGASIAKEMAPIYGEMAKEISKGIKEGLKNDEEK